jgi:hypothetical protein
MVLMIVCQENFIDTTESIIQTGNSYVLKYPSALPVREVVGHFLLFLSGKWLGTSCSFYSGSGWALPSVG